jgi:hypothetical protein
MKEVGNVFIGALVHQHLAKMILLQDPYSLEFYKKFPRKLLWS